MIIVCRLFHFNWMCNRNKWAFLWKILLFVRDWGGVTNQYRGAILGNRSIRVGKYWLKAQQASCVPWVEYRLNLGPPCWPLPSYVPLSFETVSTPLSGALHRPRPRGVPGSGNWLAQWCKRAASFRRWWLSQFWISVLPLKTVCLFQSFLSLRHAQNNTCILLKRTYENLHKPIHVQKHERRNANTLQKHSGSGTTFTPDRMLKLSKCCWKTKILEDFVRVGLHEAHRCMPNFSAPKIRRTNRTEDISIYNWICSPPLFGISKPDVVMNLQLELKLYNFYVKVF